MPTFVIVHGAFGGGWEWTPVARLLRGEGHEVFTPTLAGLGDRRHLARGVGLSTHVADITALLDLEDLQDVILCGASYGGMPVTGAADQLPARLAALVYIDALVPHDGEAAIDLLPDSVRQEVRTCLAGPGGDGTFPVPAGALPPRDGLTDESWRHYVVRLVPHPAASLVEPVRLQGAAGHLPHAFIRSTRSSLQDDPIAAMATRAQRAGWLYEELPLPHDPHLFDPSRVARLLHALVPRLEQQRMPAGRRT